jgi:hypothetical protein
MAAGASSAIAAPVFVPMTATTTKPAMLGRDDGDRGEEHGEGQQEAGRHPAPEPHGCQAPFSAA